MTDVVAAIDVGTNSFHLVVARVDGDGRFEVIEREREMVRLGSGSGDLKVIEPEAIDRGIDALSRLGRIAKASGGKIIGEFRASGLRPYTLEKARQFGFDQAYLEACL